MWSRFGSVISRCGSWIGIRIRMKWIHHIPVYQCCRSVSFWYRSGSGSVLWNNGSCSKSDLKSGKYQPLFYYFFLYKISFSKIWSVLSFMGWIFMSVNISLIVLKKMYDIPMFWVDFCRNCPWFYLIFCYPDPFHWSGSGWPKWNVSKQIRFHKTAAYDIFFILGAPLYIEKYRLWIIQEYSIYITDIINNKKYFALRQKYVLCISNISVVDPDNFAPDPHFKIPEPGSAWIRPNIDKFRIFFVIYSFQS